ncbi:leucine-rich repeat-containing protein 59-like [Photinus pyralis]|nr:leucine-rich repeat-containing protein 59-like [Photinus pyralis]
MSPSAKKLNVRDKVEDGEMDLSMLDLQEVPIKEIISIKKVHTLDLSNNHISSLPTNFSTLHCLTKLDLSKNKLTELPDNFGDLVKLKHLDLYRNQLQHLPLNFSKLRALRWLDLKDNPLVPAIANIAGPCLETKQCQDCARNIVAFYTKLEQKVEHEKNLREEQRQKNLQANMEKSKKEKAKKPKKEKLAPVKDVAQAATVTKSAEKSSNSKKNSSKNKKHTKPSVFTSIKRFFAISFLLLLTMFVLTAAKIEFMKSLEDKAVEIWYSGVDRLPNNLQGIGLEVGRTIKLLHDFTAKGVVSVSGYVNELGNNHSVNVILTEMSQVFKNATLTASKIYLKVFGK